MVAADGGGAHETVIEGETGFFFPLDDVAALARILRSGLLDDVDPSDAVENSRRFGVMSFQNGIRRHVELGLSAA